MENEIFCDLDSIKLDLDSDLFDLSPFEFAPAAFTAGGAETEGTTAGSGVEKTFGGGAQGKPKIETDDSNSPIDNDISSSSADDAKEALASLSSLLSPPSTPVITSNNLQPPSWNLDSLLKSRQQQPQAPSSHSPLEGIFTPFDAQPPPPNKNIINHQDKNVIQQILDGLQQQQRDLQHRSTSSSTSSSTAAAAIQRRPTVVVSAIQDETLKNSLPKFKLEMIKEATTSSFMTSANSTPQQRQQPTASRTLVPETNHPIMLHKPLIAKDQKSGSLQLLPESLVNMDGRILSLGDLLSASGLHKNLICNLDIKPFFSNPTTTPSGSLTPPLNSASSVNFGQYSHQQRQPQPHLKSPGAAATSKAAVVGVPSNNDHSSHGLVHKLLASPINQLVQPWQIQQQQQLQLQLQAGASSLGSASTVSTPKTTAVSDVDAAALFPTNHSALAQKKLESKSKILAEATSLENVFPDSFSNKISSSLVSNTKNGTAAAINWGGGGSGGVGESISSGKSSPENPLRSVIESRINQAKQQAALKAASPVVSVKKEVEGYVDDGSEEKSRAQAIGVFMEAEHHRHQSTPAASQQRGAISMPSSPMSCGDRESFFDAFVKTDLDEIIPEPLDNDCIICGVAFLNQAALRDHIEEHRDHMSMIQSGVGQSSASLIDSPPYSSSSSVVGSEEINNGTSSGCPSMADAAEFYVNTSMPASPASSTSSLDHLLATSASPVRNGNSNSNANNVNSINNVNNATGSTLASLLVSNISPLLSSMDAAAQQLKCGFAAGNNINNRPTPILPNQRVNQGFGHNLLTSTLGGNNNNNSNGTAVASNVALQRSGFVANLFQQQHNAGLAGAKWKKAGVNNGISMSMLLGGVGVGASSSLTDQPQFFGKVMSADQKKMLVKAVDGAAVAAAAAKAGQKRKLAGMSSGMGISKSCPVSPAMKDMMMGTLGGLEGHVAVGGGVGGAVGGMASSSDMMAGHQGPKTKKCRRVYGLNQKNLWCTQCQWKKACARFKPPKQ